MKKLSIPTFLVIIILLGSISCKKKSDMWAQDTKDKAVIESILKRLGDTKLNIPNKTIKKPDYSISRNYLKDSVDFKSLPSTKYKTDKIAVVGSNGVKLYKNIEATSEICDIPKGAILHLNKEIKKSSSQDSKSFDCREYYEFNKETNFWYETEYNDKKGYVFGSYLVFGNDSEEFDSAFSRVAIQHKWGSIRYNDSYIDKLKKLSYYYTKPVKSNSFYDFNGRLNLNKSILKSLEKNQIAIEKVSFEEYQKQLHAGDYGLSAPDDMVALYSIQHNDKMSTTFITTDLLVHTLHLIFDRMLQNTEENTLLPALTELTSAYYNELIQLESKNKNNKELSTTIDLMKKYFLIAGDLLGANLIESNSYPKDVVDELSKINDAKGMSESSVFNYKEDYTQFIPRGHYTKNDDLKKYFKAMMWFGRLHFYCVQNHPDNNLNEISIKLTKAALLLTKIAKENNQILALWHSIYNPITYIIGESDDYNLDQYISGSGEVDFINFGNWISDRNNITKFIEKINKNLKAPEISGNKLHQDEKKTSFSAIIPQGFRLFGQRFTLDGFIFTLLSSPRVGDINKARTMVKGLDVMAVLGSKDADELIKNDKKDYLNFENNYNLLRSKVNGFDDNYWRNTFYRSYLKIIKEIVNFDSKMPFYFTQSNMWDKKSLITSHGAWAELKHDTLLYGKQSAAEAAGPGPCKTWSVDNLERPVGYIEPNLGALYWIQSILDDSLSVLSNNGFMSDYFINKFKDYKELLDSVVEIAEKEAKDKAITQEQNEFIYQIPSRLAKIVTPPDGNIIDQDLLKMAIVADVHTDADKGKILEVGTGIPYRMYVALNDGNGGKRIATGYIFSYYEFEESMSNRLTDEKWKEMVYKDNVDKYIPEWATKLLSK